VRRPIVVADYGGSRGVPLAAGGTAGPLVATTQAPCCGAQTSSVDTKAFTQARVAIVEAIAILAQREEPVTESLEVSA